MKKIDHLFLWLTGLSAVLFMACSTETVPSFSAPTYDKGVLIVNEGNFLSGDGEISHYDPDSEVLTNNLYQEANGAVLGAYIEELRIFGEKAYIVGNSNGTAKVLAVDKATFEETGRVEGLEIPRNLAVAENRLFIADWGNYDDQGNYTNPNSFVAVTAINGGEILEKIAVSSRPQSIVEYKGEIFVACQTGKEVIKINPSTMEIIARQTYPGIPQDFLLHEGKLMLYSNLDHKVHLDEVNPATLQPSGKIYDIPNAHKLILNGDGEGFVLTSEFSADYSFTENQVLRFPLSGAGDITPVFQGKNLKGLGMDRTKQHLYISDDNGIQGNGTVIITDMTGEEINKLEVGRVPSKFFFY